MRLNLAVADFLLSREGSPRSTEWYTQKLNQFLFWHEAPDDLHDLSAGTCQRFLAHVRTFPGHLGRGTISTQTVHGYARALRAFLNFAVENRWVDPALPKLFKMPKRTQTLIPAFSPKQVEQLLLAAGRRPSEVLRKRDAAVVLTLVDTGIRAGELLGLTMDHLHLSAKDSYLTVLGKGDKWRSVGPLGRRCQRALLAYLSVRRDEDPHVFQTDDGQPLAMGGLDCALKWLRDESGVSGVRVSAHTFRHTYAVAYLQQPGANLYKLMLLMGHTSVATTQTYLRDFQSREARRGSSVADAFL